MDATVGQDAVACATLGQVNHQAVGIYLDFWRYHRTGLEQDAVNGAPQSIGKRRKNKIVPGK